MGMSVEISVVSDYIDRLIENIELVDYETLTITSQEKSHLLPKPTGKRAASLILNSDTQEPSTDTDTYHIQVPEIKNDFWVSITPEKLSDSLRKMESLMISDLKHILIALPPLTVGEALIYYSLKDLREVNREAFVHAVIEVDPLWKPDKKLDVLSFIAALLTEGLVDVIYLIPLNRLENYLSSHEIHSLRKWCMSNVPKALDFGGEHDRKSRLLQLTCFSTRSPDIFRDLAGFIEFAKFINWGTHFQARKAFLIIEGPQRFIADSEIEWASKHEGWISLASKTAASDNILNIGIAEEHTSFINDLLRECASFFLSRRDYYHDITVYAREYRILRGFEEFLQRLGGFRK